VSSQIVETKPTSGSAKTSDVRDNFGFSKKEIQELQRMTEDKSVSGGTLDAQTATFGHQNVELVEGSRITILVGTLKGAANDVLIHTAGASYDVGDTLNQSATTGTGSGFTCTVTKVNSGGIVAVDITNAGSNYVKDEVITLGNVSSSGNSGKLTVIASNSSTTPTLQVDSLGAYTIVRQDGTAVSAGDIKEGQYCDFLLDVNSGTPANSKWLWINSPPKFARLVSPTISNGSLSGNISGSPDFLQNPTFSGNPVFSGTPDFTGSPTATTQSVGDSSTKIATTAFVAANNALKSACQYRLQANVGGHSVSGATFVLGDTASNANYGSFGIVDDATYGGFGSPVTQSNGTFTFAETGIYLVVFSITTNTRGSDLWNGKIIGTTDNFSSSDELSSTLFGIGSSITNYQTGSCFCLFDCTDVSNDKVRLQIEGINNSLTIVRGESGITFTNVMFIRLANT